MRRPRKLADPVAFIVGACLTLAGCATSESEVPSQMRIKTNGPVKPPQVHRNLADAPLTNGTWTYHETGAGPIARFGKVGKSPRFEVRCDRKARTISLVRVGITMAETDRMRVRTDAISRNLPIITPDRRMLETLAPLSTADSLLDELVRDGTRFAIESPAYFELYLRSGPEITRIIEGCR